MKEIDQLVSEYKIKKNEIQEKLNDFKDVLNQPDERVFAELAFCLCTPQSKAAEAWNSIKTLIENKLLYTGSVEDIRPFLKPVRFCDTKAERIIEAREFFTKNGELKIKGKINSFDNTFELRDFLANNVKGIGMKEAGHFIRNIGFDYDSQLAILDRHILKNLKRIGVIKEIPKSLTRKAYLKIEEKMRKFSESIKISMYELDMLFWSRETGMVFK